MNRIINSVLSILITWTLIASENSEKKLAFNKSKIIEFNSNLREFDLNAETQNGYSITEIEYDSLFYQWKLLNEQEKVQILNKSNSYSWKNTVALYLLYSFSNKEDWDQFTNKISNYNCKGKSLTLSSVQSMITLETVRNTFLDLLQKDLDMFENGKFKINPEIKNATIYRKNIKALDRLEKWEKFINQSSNYSTADKIRKVNNFFNELIKAKSDHVINSKRDYWQSPIETLVRGKGDCEDFTLAKYISLRMLGISDKQLFIGIIRLPQFGELHAVLLFYAAAGNDPYVLDNLPAKNNGLINTHLTKLSIRISQNNIKPLIAFNENIYIEFKNGLKRIYLEKNPTIDIPMFTIALKNSKNLLSHLSG